MHNELWTWDMSWEREGISCGATPCPRQIQQQKMPVDKGHFKLLTVFHEIGIEVVLWE